MEKRKPAIFVILLLVVVLLVGAFAVFFIQKANQNETAGKDSGTSRTGTFADFVSAEVFQGVPAFLAEGTKMGNAVDYGGNTYIIDVNGTDLEDYKEYLKTLESAGFKKHSDNGEKGMEGYVYTASYTKDDVTVTVSHVANSYKTYIAATPKLPLSDYLIYDESYVANISADAKTKVHELELNSNGNSFVIELKNGHFVVEDGGTVNDAPYLLDYLEALTPGDEKPVIEAWFITHAHGDHLGAYKEIALNQEYASRIYVEGVYFTLPSKTMIEFFTNDELEKNAEYIKSGVNMFKTESGETPKLYRPQLGQRYYFCDMTIDVALTQDQLTQDSYHSADLNDTSLWLTHNIEGQKFLVGGDSGVTGTNVLMMIYDKEYFDVEVMAVLHHGINVFNYFTDFCTVDTYLYTSFREGSIYEDSSKYAYLEQNAYLKTTALECLSHGGGTVVLTFPYAVGEYQKMPASDWRYNYGRPARDVYE